MPATVQQAELCVGLDELIFYENSTKHSSPAVSACMFCICYLLEYFHMSVRNRSSPKLTGNGAASFAGLVSALITPDFAGTREQTKTLMTPGLSMAFKPVD